MCGRYQRRSDKQKIAEAFHLDNVDGLPLELAPHYNIAPQTMQPVIVWDEEYGIRTLQMMFWRFLPPFVNDPKKFKLSTILAKGETLLDSNIWKDSFLKRRCLIPVDSFIDWRAEGKTKLPWVFAMQDDEPFALGGVWRHWRSPDGKTQMDTFAVITTEPNELTPRGFALFAYPTAFEAPRRDRRGFGLQPEKPLTTGNHGPPER
jgi:putative SOS response-associated peptidase YedK